MFFKKVKDIFRGTALDDVYQNFKQDLKDKDPCLIIILRVLWSLFWLFFFVVLAFILLIYKSCVFLILKIIKPHSFEDGQYGLKLEDDMIKKT
jgi:hypothetical protein